MSLQFMTEGDLLYLCGIAGRGPGWGAWIKTWLCHLLYPCLDRSLSSKSSFLVYKMKLVDWVIITRNILVHKLCVRLCPKDFASISSFNTHTSPIRFYFKAHFADEITEVERV